MKMQDIAREYLAQGFNVIPILPEGKKPALASWMEFNDHKPSKLDIQSWFTGKSVNIGIVTGKISKIVVVDIDKPELFSSFIEQYPTHRVQRTPKGGYHLLYRYEGDDIGNSVSRLSNGIDVRGRHGYIVTAPSTIRLDNGTLQEYHWQEVGDILPLPSDLHDTIISEITRQTDTYDIQTLQNDAINLYSQVLSVGFTPGQHNEQTKDIARLLFRKGMASDLIFITLEQLNNKDDSPLPRNELIATVNSGIKYERDRLAEKEQQTKEATVPFSVSLKDLRTRYKDYKREWLIDEWLMRGSIIVITAPPENYKTWVALEAGVQVSLGSQSSSFLNGGWYGKTEPKPVLIVQQEDNMALILERLEVILKAKQVVPVGETPIEPAIFFHTESQLALDDEASILALEKSIVDHKIEFVIIDPVYSLATSDDFFASMARKLSVIKNLRNKYGTTFLFVHHNKKGTTGLKDVKELAREGMFGSQLLNGAFEGMWMMNTLADEAKTRIIGRTGKSFTGAQKVWGIDFQIETPDIFVQGQDYPDSELHYKVRLKLVGDETLTENQTKMRTALQEMIEGTRSRILEAAGLGKDSRAAKKEFDELVAMGAIVEKCVKGKVIYYEFALAY